MLNDLAERAQRGEPDPLFSDVDALLWSHARRWRHPWYEPEDIYQLAAVGVLIAIEKWEPSRGDFLPCMLNWIRGTIGNFVRRQGPVSCVHSHGDIDEDDPILQRYDDLADVLATTPDPRGLWDRKLMLEEAGELLRPRDRWILDLYLEGKLQKEIADTVGITSSAVSQRFNVILDRLRMCLA